jgi:hypothetical protein
MAEVKAIKILVDSLTFGGTVYAAGQVVLDATEEMLACADSKRTNDAGKLLCKRLAKQDALKAAKRYDAGEEAAPLAQVPTGTDPDEAPAVVNDKDLDADLNDEGDDE